VANSPGFHPTQTAPRSQSPVAASSLQPTLARYLVRRGEQAPQGEALQRKGPPAPAVCSIPWAAMAIRAMAHQSLVVPYLPPAPESNLPAVIVEQLSLEMALAAGSASGPAPPC